MRRLLLIVVALLLLAGVIFIPDWFEDPRRLAPGEWVEQSTRLQAEVTDQDIPGGGSTTGDASLTPGFRRTRSLIASPFAGGSRSWKPG